MAETEKPDLTTLTVALLSAYVTNNTVESADLAGLIQSTHGALNAIDAPAPPEVEAPEYFPAVTARKSLGSRDHILSMIDGKPYKALKRHLTSHGLTPAEYRARYKLPATYPMVAESYSEQRREVAARLGLGRRPKPASTPSEEPASPITEPVTAAPTAPPESVAPAVPAAAPAKARRAVPQKPTPMKVVDTQGELEATAETDATAEAAVSAPSPSKPTRVKAAKSNAAVAPTKVPAKSAKSVAKPTKFGGAMPAAPKAAPKKRLSAKFAEPAESAAE